MGCGRVSPLAPPATSGPVVPAPDDNSEYGAVDGKRIGKVNRSNRRTLPPVPLELTGDRTRVAAVGSRRLTA
jgi:hypothetical protein